MIVMAKRVVRFFTVPFPIDGDEVRLRVARLSPDEFADYERNLFRFGRVGHRRTKALKAAGEDDEAQDRVIAQIDQERAEERVWHSEVIDRYLSVEPGELEDVAADGTAIPVTSGRDLVRLYGQGDLVSSLIALIYGENKLKDSEKNVFRSQLVSGNGLGAPLVTPSAPDSPATPGSAPDSAATDAEPLDSTEPEVATSPSTAPEGASCGTTAR
jgi:hypothetical protein